MNAPATVAVIDYRQDHAKLALVDLDSLTRSPSSPAPNSAPRPPWPIRCGRALGFLLDRWGSFHRPRTASMPISVTTHGACAATCAEDETLAAPILDYEHTYPDEIIAAYDQFKPDFRADRIGQILDRRPHIARKLLLPKLAAVPSLRGPGLPDFVDLPANYWGHRLTGVAAKRTWDLHRLATPILGAARGGVLRFYPPPRIEEQSSRRCDAPLTSWGLFCANRRGHGTALRYAGLRRLSRFQPSLYPHILAKRGLLSGLDEATWVVVMSMAGATLPLDQTRLLD